MSKASERTERMKRRQARDKKRLGEGRDWGDKEIPILAADGGGLNILRRKWRTNGGGIASWMARKAHTWDQGGRTS